MSLTQIEKEMNAAQHLLYVSLKYTKTGDVILNLMHRWQQMIEICVDSLLNKAKKKKLTKEIPTTPKQKVELLQKIFKKEPVVLETLLLYSFFRRLYSLEMVKEHEFRKNVTLRVIDISGKEIAIDVEKLKEWGLVLENFIKFVRAFTA